MGFPSRSAMIFKNLENNVRMFLKRFVRTNQSSPPDMLMRKNVTWLAAENVPQFQENNAKTSKRGHQNKSASRFAILSTRSNANKFLREFPRRCQESNAVQNMCGIVQEIIINDRHRLHIE